MYYSISLIITVQHNVAYDLINGNYSPWALTQTTLRDLLNHPYAYWECHRTKMKQYLDLEAIQ